MMLDEQRVAERDAILSGLDSLGFGGAWDFISTGGGCTAYECELSGGGRLMVTGEDTLTYFGDIEDFGTGVMVGFYPVTEFDAEWCEYRDFTASGSVSEVVSIVRAMVDEFGVEVLR
jgi:hypothetical protein